MERIFDIHRDNKLIAKGNHFWCVACLVARPLKEQSLDPRYCQGCYKSLSHEAQLLAESGSWKHPKWIPVAKEQRTAQEPIPQEKMKMLTVNSTGAIGNNLEVSVSKSHLSGRPTSYKKRELPEELIKQLNREGLGSKAITSRLKKQGYIISAMTVSRILSGKR